MSSRCSRKQLNRSQKMSNNNINININFSVKEKGNLFGGKKIDNCIQITNSSHNINNVNNNENMPSNKVKNNNYLNGGKDKYDDFKDNKNVNRMDERQKQKYLLKQKQRQKQRYKPTKYQLDNGLINNNNNKPSSNSLLNNKKSNHNTKSKNERNIIEQYQNQNHLGNNQQKIKNKASSSSSNSLSYKNKHNIQLYQQQTPQKYINHNNNNSYKANQSKSKSKSQSKTKSKSYKNLATIQQNHNHRNYQRQTFINKSKPGKSMEHLNPHKLKNKSYSPYSQSPSKSYQLSDSKSKSKNKSKSKSKSHKILLKSKRNSASQSGLHIKFQNSGIKRHLINQQNSQNQQMQQNNHQSKRYKQDNQKRQKSNSTTNNKSSLAATGNHKMSEEQFNNIQAYMNQKKKRQKKQREKAKKLQKQIIQKRKEEIRKVQQQQKKNATKKLDISPYSHHENMFKRKSVSKSRKKLSIPNPTQPNSNDEYFNQFFDEDASYNKLRQQAQILIYQNDKSNQQSPSKQYDQSASQSFKRLKRDRQLNNQKEFHKKLFKGKNRNQSYKIVKNYLKGKSTISQLNELNKIAQTIQKFYRGYKIRQKFANQLNTLQTKIESKRNRFRNLKNSNFWNDQSNSNSIIRLQNRSQVNQEYNSKQSQSINDMLKQIKKMQDQGKAYQKFHQLPDLSLKNKQIKEYYIQEQEHIQKNINSNDKFMQELQQLRKNLKDQHQKYKKLQEQNLNLKKNIQQTNSAKKQPFSDNKIYKQRHNLQISQKFQHNILPNKSHENTNQIHQLQEVDQKFCLNSSQLKSHQFQQASTQFKNKQNQINLKSFNKEKGKELTEKKQEKKKIQIQISQDYESSQDRQEHLKKIMQAFTCSPKSSLTASRIKDPNIMQIFNKKELKLENKFQKKTQMFEKMLSDHLVSPRTYNMKIIDLQKNYQKERKYIQKKKDQAKKVAQYLNRLQKQVENLDENLADSKQLEQSQQQESSSNNNEQLHQNTSSQGDQINQHNNKKWIKTIQQIDKQVDFQKNKKQNQKKIQKQHKFSNKQLNQEQQVDQIQQQIVIQPISNKNLKAEQIFNKIKKANANQELGQSQSQSQSHEEDYQKSQVQQSHQSQKIQPISKGFQTNLTFIKQYCIQLCQFIRGHDHLRQQFWKNISNPISYDHFQMLKAYRTTLDNENSSIYNSHKKQFLYPFFKIIFPKILAIPRQVFDEFNQSNNKLTENQEIKYLQRCYLESILDAFNESLDYQRPGSIFGQQLPWSANSKHLKNLSQLPRDFSGFNYEINQQQQQKKFDQFFGVAIARLIQWGSSLCGFIPQSLQLQPNQKIQFDQQQINHVRQTRMALMLQKTIKDDDDNMINSDLQITQVKLALGVIIFQDLMREAAQDMDFISEKNYE